jgi:hypothetical protein
MFEFVKESVSGYPALVSKLFAKEDAREFSMIVPSFLAYFIPHLWIIPVGIVNK